MQSVLKLQRQPSLLKHSAKFDEIIQKSIEEIFDNFDGIVVDTLKDVKEGKDMALEMLMTRFASDLQRRVDLVTHELVEDSWSTVTNKGALRKAEMRVLVGNVLTGLSTLMEPDKKTGWSHMVKDCMEPAATNLKNWIQSDAVGPMGMRHGGTADIVLDMNVKTRIEKASTKFTELLKVMMVALLKESDAISDEIFDMVDVDKDGNVTKREFCKNFATAFGWVVDFNKITMLTIKKHRRMLTRPNMLTRSSSMMSTMMKSTMTMITTDYVQTGLVVMALSMAALVLVKRKPSALSLTRKFTFINRKFA